MYLKEIKAYGFKSFADKTSIEFGKNLISDTLHGLEAPLEKCRMMPLSLPWASAL